MINEGDYVKIYDSAKVRSIYMGKDNHCRCGCAGEYVKRGEPKFDRRLMMFQKKLLKYTPTKDDIMVGEYVNVSYGNNRALTVYFER